MIRSHHFYLSIFSLSVVAGCGGDDSTPQATPTNVVDGSVPAVDSSRPPTTDGATVAHDAGGPVVGPDPKDDVPGKWVNATSSLTGMASECGNISFVGAKPDENLMLTGVAQKGLFASTNAGSTWQALGTGAGSSPVTNRTSDFVFDPTHTKQFWESGIYNGSGVYLTTDDGTTVLAQGKVGHNDSVSVDFTDPNRKTLLAGGHEQAQTIYRSTDGGQTWTNIGAKFPGGTNFSTEVMVIDAQTYLVGCSGWGQGTNGIYRTTNGGDSWTQVSSSAGTGHPLHASDGSIYWFTGNGLVRSQDSGANWTTMGSNGMIKGAPVELPNGRLAALGGNNVMVSSDKGATWATAADPYPFSGPNGVTYSPYWKAFFLWHFSCGNGDVPVPSDGIMRARYE